MYSVDSHSAKVILLSLPRPFSGYAAHISTCPRAWDNLAVPTVAQCEARARQLAALARRTFPGLVATISTLPDHCAYGGSSGDILMEINDWLVDQSGTVF